MEKVQGRNVLLALKVLHDIEKPVVYVWSILELYLDRVEVAERIGHVEWSLWAGGCVVHLCVHDHRQSL